MLALTIQPVPKVGDVAPDFSLKSTSGEEVSLSAYRGKQAVLLAFFPLAFTSTCTKEMCAFTEDYDEFARHGVQVIPISVDATASLKEYKAKLGMKVDMLSDFRRTASALYGVLMMDRYYANRAYFLIDKEGVLRWAHVEENPSHRREDAEILEAIRGLKD